jgi:hypothetical protein
MTIITVHLSGLDNTAMWRRIPQVNVRLCVTPYAKGGEENVHQMGTEFVVYTESTLSVW